MKVKVLHVVLSLETGGLENGVINLINHSDSNHFIVDVICLREKGELASRITNPNSKVIYDGSNDHSLKSAVLRLLNATSQGQYHIIHTHGFSTMLAAYVANLFTIKNKPILINGEHGTLYFDTFKHRTIQKFLFNRMNKNLTVSAELKTEIFHRFNINKDNFYPIINGVDTHKFSPNEYLSNMIREKLNISKNSIIIGSVGRLVSVKNYDSLIAAFSSLVDTYSNIHLVLAGEGPERTSLEFKAKQYNIEDRVHLLGRRDDVNSIINAIDIFVLPSFSEGLSNTLLESMSCGTPVIACNVGGNPEIIVENQTGYLYESNNISELSKLLKNLISNPLLLKDISVKARQHILDNFSLDTMVKNYEAEYIRCLPKHRRSLPLTSFSKQ